MGSGLIFLLNVEEEQWVRSHFLVKRWLELTANLDVGSLTLDGRG